MTFELHLPTLLLMSIALNSLIGALLWWIYHLRGRQSCFLYWAFACVTFAAGSLMAGARMLIDLPLVTVFAAHGLLGLSPLLVLAGLQGFSRAPRRQHRRFRNRWALGFGVYLVALLVTFGSSDITPRAITAVFSALIFSLAIFRLSAISARIQMPVHVLQVLFTIHGILMLVQALVIITNAVAGQVQGFEFLLRLILINHILLATGTALALPLMAFSLSERRLRTLAERDGLTGLYNRRSLFREGIRLFSKARAGSLPLAVLMVDLDHFKGINDQWGHAVGDEALRLVARTLEREIREGDIVGRVGGEEFTVVIPLADTDKLCQITGRLLKAIAGLNVQAQGHRVALSASIGGIERNAGHKTFADMMLDADSALYTAKNNGRNRAEFHDAPEGPVTV